MAKDRIVQRWLLILALAFTAGCAASEQASKIPLELQSEYVEMRDGTLIAVDTWVPQVSSSAKIPAIVLFTRYWRAHDTGSTQIEDDINFKRAEQFAQAGYALVMVDVRGTGASFGPRRAEFAPEEIEDLGEIVQWIASQPWSNGRVAATGSSYLGNTAEMAAIHGGVAFRAAAPRFSDFDLYRYAVFPGGVPNTVLLNAWASIVSALDKNDPCVYASEDCASGGRGVKPVSGAEALLDAAIRSHQNNLDVSTLLQNLEFIDDSASSDGDLGVTLSSVSPSMQLDALDRAVVPMQFWVSWYDAATADGALSRFMTSQTPMQLIIGPWNHGASVDANPYTPFDSSRVEPSVEEQYQQIFEFFDRFMQENETAAPESRIDYFTVGANEWRSTDVWPPADTRFISLYAADNQALQEQALGGANTGKNTYQVDFTISTGEENRWTTQLGTPVDYGNWITGERLSYTSPPLAEPLEITGHPVVELWLSSSTPDGAVYVYLEDVGEDGKATYLTEGLLRLKHRALSTESPGFRVFGPFHSFKRADMKPMPGTSPELITFQLLPISVEIAAGHRIRLSIAGADASAFARIPHEGPAPVYDIHYGGSYPTRIVLPVGNQISFSPRGQLIAVDGNSEWEE